MLFIMVKILFESMCFPANQKEKKNLYEAGELMN